MNPAFDFIKPTFSLLIFLLPYLWGNSQSLVVGTGETYIIDSSSVEFDSLELQEGATLQLKHSPSLLKIGSLKTGANALILGMGRKGADGRKGKKGGDGGDGGAGGNGIELDLEIRSFDGNTLTINLNGGPGGSGGDGANGGLEVNECYKNKTGKSGGNGGNAGPGGNGGNLILKVPSELMTTLEQALSFSAKGGKPGKPGAAGLKGEIKIIANCHKGGKLKEGKDGIAGKPSKEGTEGKLKVLEL